LKKKEGGKLSGGEGGSALFRGKKTSHLWKNTKHHFSLTTEGRGNHFLGRGGGEPEKEKTKKKEGPHILSPRMCALCKWTKTNLSKNLMKRGVHKVHQKKKGEGTGGLPVSVILETHR